MPLSRALGTCLSPVRACPEGLDWALSAISARAFPWLLTFCLPCLPSLAHLHFGSRSFLPRESHISCLACTRRFLLVTSRLLYSVLHLAIFAFLSYFCSSPRPAHILGFFVAPLQHPPPSPRVISLPHHHRGHPIYLHSFDSTFGCLFLTVFTLISFSLYSVLFFSYYSSSPLQLSVSPCPFVFHLAIIPSPPVSVDARFGPPIAPFAAGSLGEIAVIPRLASPKTQRTQSVSRQPRPSSHIYIFPHPLSSTCTDSFADVQRHTISLPRLLCRSASSLLSTSDRFQAKRL